MKHRRQDRDRGPTNGVPQRPKSWANWRAHLAGDPVRSAYEYDLYSDSEVNGTTRDLGPYSVMNLIAGERRETALARPVMALRVGHATNPNPQEEDADKGRRLPDEIAALASLVLGIRLHAGGATRYFDFRDKDEPLGAPKAQAEAESPVLLPGAWTQVIAHGRRTIDLDELDLLDTYPKLEASAANALMRSARLYQEALWLSERETWLTWLLLVSAIESAANEHTGETATSPSDLLRELDPRLAKVVAKYGEECVKEVAETQVKLLGATKKFLGFLQNFMPDPPAVRPSEYRLDWTSEGIREPLKEVYRMRSTYLHAGVPLPWQLHRAPEPFDGVPTETHPDHIEEARWLDGRRVSHASLGMHVHVFEYIARGALLRWWRSLVDGGVSLAPADDRPDS